MSGDGDRFRDVESAFRAGRRALEEGGVAAARLTAGVLLCHALGRERSYLYGHPEYRLSASEQQCYESSLRERLRGKPTQYITGRQEFYGRLFRVTSDVMIPRPETEHLVEVALELGRSARRVLDAGCGSGAIAVTLALETELEVWASDISLPALHVTASNAEALGARVRLVTCDLAAAFADGSMDLLVSNPPYVPEDEKDTLQREVRDYEPPLALFGGPTGLDFYSRLIREGSRLLRPGGWLIMELGIRQLAPVKTMFGDSWRQTKIVDDLAGLPRVLAARYSP